MVAFKNNWRGQKMAKVDTETKQLIFVQTYHLLVHWQIHWVHIIKSSSLNIAIAMYTDFW